MPDQSPVAFVFELDVNGLGVVRSLGRAKVPVVGLYTSDEDIGRLSRYCTAVGLAQDLAGSRLTDVVMRLADRYKHRPVLLPTTDAYAQWINDEQERLKERFRFHSNRRDLFQKLNSKLGIISLVREHGLPAPWTRHYETLREFEAEAADFPLPVIVKPVDTFARCLPDRTKNVVFNAIDALRDYVTRHRAYLRNMVFQQVVESGDGRILICTLLLDRDGRPVMWYTGRKLRQYHPDYGVTTFGVSEVDEELAQRSIAFMQAVGYRGICTLEFAEDKRTGERLFLEVNLRSYFHNQLFYDCGLNFPYAEYCLLIGRDLPPGVVGLRRSGLYWLDFNRDVGSFYHKNRAGQLGLARWMGSLIRARSFAAFALDDARPWLLRSLSLLGILARRIGRRRGGDEHAG